MHLDMLQAISLNGHSEKPNDDRFGSTSQLAWVIDGATDLGSVGLLGTQGGASWLASTASNSFAATDGQNIEDICRTVFLKAETQFEMQKAREVVAEWETPKAAFGAVLLTCDGLSVAWAADSPIMLMSGNDVIWCTGKPDTLAEAEDAKALGAGVGASKAISDAVLEDRRANRENDNHVAISPSAKASALATCFSHYPVSVGDELLLMSDGFASLVTDYEKYSAQELAVAVRSKGLGVLAHEIRMVETEDAACLRFPRFKVSDDATAIWLRVAG